jgi:hypothetical protein
MLFSSAPAWSAIDCSPLDPRGSVSRELEGKAEASAATVFKVGKAGGSIEGKWRESIQNLAPAAAADVQAQVKYRFIYLFCNSVVSANDISTERKSELIEDMYRLMNEPSGVAGASGNAAKQPGKSSRPHAVKRTAKAPEKTDLGGAVTLMAPSADGAQGPRMVMGQPQTQDENRVSVGGNITANANGRDSKATGIRIRDGAPSVEFQPNTNIQVNSSDGGAVSGVDIGGK